MDMITMFFRATVEETTAAEEKYVTVEIGVAGGGVGGGHGYPPNPAHPQYG